MTGKGCCMGILYPNAGADHNLGIINPNQRC
jgi:hypothetical protein